MNGPEDTVPPERAQMAEQLSKEYVRGTVTHVHDRRTTNGDIVICITLDPANGTESIPVTYTITGSPEQENLPEAAASVKVGDEVDTWYTRQTDDSSDRATGHTLRILG